MDEQNTEYQLPQKEEAVVGTPVETAEEPEVKIKEVIVKKKKKKAPEGVTQGILIAIIVVGICLFCVSLLGIFNTIDEVGNSDVRDETTTSATNNPVENVNTNNETTTAVNNADVTVPDDTADSGNAENNENTENNENSDNNNDNNSGNTVTTGPQSDAEWLTFFNTAVNKLKTDGLSFSKAKRTQTADIQLSNPLAQAYVSIAKDKYLSDETAVTDVKKGDKANAVAVVSPDGENYVSKLTMGDIKSITHTVNADGNYEITITMPDAENPDLSSSYGKIFEFMLVDDVMETYAPNMGATVDKSNVTLKYNGCYAKAVVTPDGKLVSYETKVNANMILKSAKISVVTTDLDVVLFSDTSYTKIVY